MNRSDFLAIIVLHWALFASILFVSVLIMDTNNIKNELKYMKNYHNALTSKNLQDVMCNGSPAE